MTPVKTMKAIGYTAACAIDAPNALVEFTAPIPEITANDLLVEVRGISVNPVDTKIRKAQSPDSGHKIIGYDAAGIVRATGNGGDKIQNRRRSLLRGRHHSPRHKRPIPRGGRTNSRSQTQIAGLRAIGGDGIDLHHGVGADVRLPAINTRAEGRDFNHRRRGRGRLNPDTIGETADRNAGDSNGFA